MGAILISWRARQCDAAAGRAGGGKILTDVIAGEKTMTRAAVVK